MRYVTSCSDLFDDEDTAVVVRCHALASEKPNKTEKSSEGLQKIHEDDQNESENDGEEDDDDDDSDDDDSYTDDDDFSMEDFESVDGKAKTALTSYSMSSSVMPRNAGLSLLDDRFEKVEIRTFCLLSLETFTERLFQFSEIFNVIVQFSFPHFSYLVLCFDRYTLQ